MKRKVEFSTPEAERDYKKFKKAMDKKHSGAETKRVYCEKCQFHKLGSHTFIKSISLRKRYFQDYGFGPMPYCIEPHKFYCHSAITKIDESDNCFIKNKDNNCKYFKKKVIE